MPVQKKSGKLLKAPRTLGKGLITFILTRNELDVRRIFVKPADNHE